jgi:hypothetical protein
MKYKTTFITIAFFIASIQLFGQIDRKGAKHMDTCIVSVISTERIVKEMPIDSTNHFFVKCNCDLPMYRLSIFDRWGNVVLTSYNINEEIKFSEIKNGTYVWVLEVKYPIGKKDSRKGTIKIE